MNEAVETKRSSSIILLNDQFNEIDQHQNEFDVTEETELKNILAKIGFDESKLIKNIKPTSAVAKAMFIGLPTSALLFFFVAMHTEQSLWLSGCFFSLVMMMPFASNVNAEFLSREISHERYKHIALVAKYNSAVHQYAKEKLNKNQKIINEDYCYMNIQLQYFRVVRFLEHGLEDKRKAISEILK